MDEGLRSAAHSGNNQPQMIEVLTSSNEVEGSQSRLSFLTRVENDLKKITPESSNALLIVLGLVLTMTYTALLSPPGDVNDGKSVLKPVEFGLFFAANSIAFLMTCVITGTLISMVVAKSILSLAAPVYFSICICYVTALLMIAPTPLTGVVTVITAVILVGIIFICYDRFKK